MGETASRVMLYGLAGLVFSVDRFTKWIIETRLDRLDSHVVIPGFFEIVHSENSGAAFGR
jgi:signal peptidase II